MSTTKKWKTALGYSSKDGQRSTILEITVGRVDVGADIGFLSQYPNEAEILLQPLSCLEACLPSPPLPFFVCLAQHSPSAVPAPTTHNRIITVSS